MTTDPITRLLATPPDLPIVAGLAELTDVIMRSGVAVVQAPSGSGKTTLVPPAVAAVTEGRVVVTQPRRIAARAAARRLADLLGEPVGRTVGYSVRGDRKVSDATRIEMVTSGVLLRRLQRDPELPGVGAVVLDEVHERQLDADLTLAFALDARATLRDDMRIVAMSATVEAERFAEVLSGATVVDVPGALHPVDVRWHPADVLPVDERGVPPRFLDHVAATVRTALTEQGDVLVFVPGVREIEQVVRRLSDLSDVDVLALHGRLSPAEQDRALRPGDRRRIVVSTAVAESSLTVPGVRVVVDAGLSREPRTDQRRGLPSLVTVRVSRASADQRAGRAGREGPGVVLRCWSRAEHGHLDAHPRPEVAVADLTGFALELAAWGTPSGEGLALLDDPPGPSMEAARATLVNLGVVDDDGVVTERGREIAAIPVDPRLARALLDGAPRVGSRRAAEVVALLDDEVRAPGGDLVAALREARRSRHGSWTEAVRRLESLVPSAPATDLTDDVATGLVVALAHPGRIARRRSSGSSYLMVGGTGASFREGSPLGEWIAIADADRRAGAGDATIRAAAPLDEDLALESAAGAWREDVEVTWTKGRVSARQVIRLGAIELQSVTVPNPPAELVDAARTEALRRDGLDALRWSETARALRRRLAFLHLALGDPWPDVSDDALAEALGPDLDVTVALKSLLPWPEAARLDELAPERIAHAEGSAAIDYTDPAQPFLPLRVQEAFGWTETPRLAGGRVPLVLHLLTPARRPAAVTADLASFWAGPYHQVRAELRGRYPKHAWPEDPSNWSPGAERR